MDLYFVTGSLKTNDFILMDAPLEGFKIVCWRAWTLGSLWKLKNEDIGLSIPGYLKVYGQVWKPQNKSAIALLGRCSGLHTGLTRPEKIKINIESNGNSELQTTSFVLANIDPSYEKIKSFLDAA